MKKAHFSYSAMKNKEGIGQGLRNWWICRRQVEEGHLFQAFTALQAGDQLFTLSLFLTRQIVITPKKTFDWNVAVAFGCVKEASPQPGALNSIPNKGADWWFTQSMPGKSMTCKVEREFSLLPPPTFVKHSLPLLSTVDSFHYVGWSLLLFQISRLPLLFTLSTYSAFVSRSNVLEQDPESVNHESFLRECSVQAFFLPLILQDAQTKNSQSCFNLWPFQNEEHQCLHFKAQVDTQKNTQGTQLWTCSLCQGYGRLA